MGISSRADRPAEMATITNNRAMVSGDGSHHPGNHGFALIVALALMGFITLLLISLATLVQVEASRTQTEINAIEARQNALLGMRLALAELQLQAGPDQRVTARAEILTPDAGELEPGTRYWTGVWRTDTPVGEEPQQPRWLVSLAQPNQTPQQPPNSGLGEMVGSGAVTAEILPVAAPAAGPSNGGYACWVGDEGVKAKVNLSATDSVRPENAPFTHFAERSGIELVSGFEELGSPSDPDGGADTHSLIGRIHHLDQSALLADSIAAVLPDRYFDLTTYSSGVLSSTSSGGLKRDLTEILGRDSLSGTLWQEPRPGPSWNLFRQFYHLKDAQQVETDGNNLPGVRVLPVQASGPMEFRYTRPGGYPDNPSIHPIIAWAGLTYGLFAVAEDPEAIEAPEPGYAYYRLMLAIKPSIALWNPYDVAIHSETGYIVDHPTQSSRAHLRTPMLWLRNDLSGDDSESGWTITLNTLLPEYTWPDGSDPVPQNSSAWVNSLRFTIAPTTLLPGEVAWFSLPAGTQSPYEMTPPDDGGPDNPALFERGGPLLERGFRPAPYLYVPIRNGTLEDGSPLHIATRFASNHPSFTVFDGDIGLIRVPITAPPEGASPAWISIRNDGRGETHQAIRLSPGSTTLENPSLPVHRSPQQNRALQHLIIIENKVSAPVGWAFSDAASVEQILVSNDPIDIISSAVILMTPGWTDRHPTLNTSGIKILANYNLRSRHSTASRYSHSGNSITKGFADNAPTYMKALGNDPGSPFFDESRIFPPGTVREVQISDPDGDGNDTRFIGPIIAHIPHEQLFSIAQMKHLDTANSAWSPTYIIGNSYASPWIQPDQIAVDLGLGTLEDLSFQLNRFFWDDYYFSTWEPISGERPANPRLIQTSPANALITADVQASAALMINGSFNINSTSVEAWKAILASLNQTEFTLGEVGLGQIETLPLRSPFPRSPTADIFGGQPSTDGLNPDTWRRIPELTPEQIDALAKRIVVELRQRREPFQSVAEFVNREHLREPDTDQEELLPLSRNPQLMGILQRALDATYIESDQLDGQAIPTDPINPRGNQASNVSITPSPSETIAAEYEFPLAAAGLRSQGAPGYLLQSDILTTLGPILSARSDTFTIRAYGESPAGTTQNLSHAWCEAIVQRIPEYIIPANSQSATAFPFVAQAADEIPLGINEHFGRRFVVIAFRWLNEDER